MIEDDQGKVLADKFAVDGGKTIDHVCDIAADYNNGLMAVSIGSIEPTGLAEFNRLAAIMFQGPAVGHQLLLLIPTPVEWASLPDGPVPNELMGVRIDLSRRWWVGRVGESNYPHPDRTPEQQRLVPDDLHVFGALVFSWASSGADGTLTLRDRHQADIDEERAYYEQCGRDYENSGLSRDEMILTNLLYAIQAFDGMYNMSDRERQALELVKERLCLRLADNDRDTEASLYGQCYVVHGHHVLRIKERFFGKAAKLEYPEQSDPDVMLYHSLAEDHGTGEAAKQMREHGAGLFYRDDFLPPAEGTPVQ
jgi:hypothetical protein